MHTKFSWGLLSEYRKELMGCSIIGIVLFHWYENCAKHGVSTGMIIKTFSFGSRFVDVFLVLSGIGLFYSFSHRNDINAFYKKRMIKILPTYCIIAFPYWIIEDFFIAGKGWKQFFFDFAFISFFTQGNRRFWFVVAIILFYLLFPVVYRSLYYSGRKLQNSCFLIIGYLFIVTIVWKFLPTIYNNIEIGLWRWLSFFAGIYVAPKVKEGDNISIWSVIFLLGTAVSLFVSYGSISSVFLRSFVYRLSGVFLGMAATLIIAIVLSIIKKYIYFKPLLTVLRVLGELTLEIYMLHVAFRSLFNYPVGAFEYGLLILLSVVLAVAINKMTKMIQKNALS